MKVNKVTIWNIANNFGKGPVSPEEERAAEMFNLIRALFGKDMTYEPLSNYKIIIENLVQPVLRARYPQIINSKKEDLDDQRLDITTFKICKGLEWKTLDWQNDFRYKLKNLQNH